MAYILVKTKSASWLPLGLPATIGSGPTSDIVVNSAALAPLAYVAAETGGNLQVTHVADQTPVEAGQLAALGIKIAGPVSGYPGKSLVQRLRETIAREHHFVSYLPAFGRTILLGGFPPAVRYLMFLVLGAIVVTLGIRGEQAANTVPDLSRIPVSIGYDVVHTDRIGASASFKGYERGATLRFNIPAEAREFNQLVTFEAAGLNYGEEIIIAVNGQVVFTSEANPECITEFCSLSAIVTPKMLLPGQNELEFRHQPQTSAWFINHVHIRPVPPATDVERADLDRRLVVAERAFAERDISPENLLLAADELQGALAMASRRTGLESEAARVEVLNRQVLAAIESTVNNLWGDVEIAMRLGNTADAQRSLRALLQLFPDPASAGHQRVRETMDTLKEVKS